jgi:hypothetical protein
VRRSRECELEGREHHAQYLVRQPEAERAAAAAGREHGGGLNIGTVEMEGGRDGVEHQRGRVECWRSRAEHRRGSPHASGCGNRGSWQCARSSSDHLLMLVAELLPDAEPVQFSTGLSVGASGASNDCRRTMLPAPSAASSAGARCGACPPRERRLSCRLRTRFASPSSSASSICVGTVVRAMMRV